ncbi:viperin family antiviral radical SAM protein [Corallococcus sp. M34]|uniref:viperin family antiviral radical SAM protein n=1 Tax=Citreicoccus inhibens TaxID=2849499 RepID=UPI001C2455E0|nr:viperin family antiviral radical SAM protein [Citreicoccus inhibens]MBU8898840.1 viperin family antiviral radical SAM protein [Citreicoccus inhibens]
MNSLSSPSHSESPSLGAKVLPASVNFHLWEPCNMRCRFCFATFKDVRADVLPKGHLPEQEALRLVDVLAHRFKKITFAGGEPLLCPWLPDLAKAAKAHGAITMLVTNGSQLRADTIARLRGVMDWVTLSIDSISPETHVKLGRAVQGRALSPADYVAMAEGVRAAGMRLKINTVVTQLNKGEDQTELLRALRPERWKLLNILRVEGQNSGKVDGLCCDSQEFNAFVARHRALEGDGIVLVPEDNEDMLGSYAMVDPAGRFFDNAEGKHRYSAPILAQGLDSAWAQVAFSMERFERRGGLYDFNGRP